MNDFIPVLRFAVTSDVHYKEKGCKEQIRFEKGMKDLYDIAEKNEYYKGVDALFVVGDFANAGLEDQMLLFKSSLDKCIKKDTKVVLSMASHEFHGEGEDAARERFARIFNQPADMHIKIKDFHFISITTTGGTRFKDAQISFAKKSLEEAFNDDSHKPIFFFQHPHITGTVYGSCLWGEDDMTALLVNYPQIIDFSGHSHAPINDPRSIHQQHFTSLGTGTFSYFELDEFDKVYGTCPPDKDEAAQFLIVEADEKGRVRVYPYDVITGNFFPYVWKIDEPCNPDSFIYTNEKRYKTDIKPYFNADADCIVTKTPDGVKFDFAQAHISEDYVNDYTVTIKRKTDGAVVRRFAVWSSYYLYNMPERVVWTTEPFEKGDYTAEIRARGFWFNAGDGIIKTDFTV